MGTFWIVTFGCAASKDLMTLGQRLTSVPTVALFHQVNVTLALVLALLELPAPLAALELLELPLLHAAAAVAAASATATAASARLLRMVGHLLK
jgi:hypothetical protein